MKTVYVSVLLKLCIWVEGLNWKAGADRHMQLNILKSMCKKIFFISSPSNYATLYTILDKCHHVLYGCILY